MIQINLQVNLLRIPYSNHFLLIRDHSVWVVFSLCFMYQCLCSCIVNQWCFSFQRLCIKVLQLLNVYVSLFNVYQWCLSPSSNDVKRATSLLTGRGSKTRPAFDNCVWICFNSSLFEHLSSKRVAVMLDFRCRWFVGVSKMGAVEVLLSVENC